MKKDVKNRFAYQEITFGNSWYVVYKPFLIFSKGYHNKAKYTYSKTIYLGAYRKWKEASRLVTSIVSLSIILGSYFIDPLALHIGEVFVYEKRCKNSSQNRSVSSQACLYQSVSSKNL